MSDRALLLVAEDDPDDQYFFQEAAAVACAQDVELRFALDGVQLMKLLQEQPQHAYRCRLVVLDLQMQVQDGRATLQALKADPAFSHIPVVILTTSDDASDRQYCQAAGAAAYYRKPSSIVGLVGILRELTREYLEE